MNYLNKRPVGKVRSPCPKCGWPVRERFQDGKKLNVSTWLLFSLLTCGLGLLTFPLFTRPKYALDCVHCYHVEDDE